MSVLTFAKSSLRCGLAAALLASCAPSALHAETSNAELAKEIAELKAQIRELKGAVSATRTETRRTSAKVREVASRPVVLPPPGPALPYGAVPAFVTADNKLQFGALTITPGGFLAAESVFRSRTQQADISSNYQAIPFGPQGATNEYRLTARQSRIALLAEAAVAPTMLASGYMELDFLGAGSANANESNSYNPRIRHLYATLDNSEYGLHVLAGQSWSLLTLNSKGITPRNEVTPPTIDAQYVPGFDWKRQAQIRLTKDFDKKLWLSVSAEEAQTTFGQACTAGVNGTAVAGLPGTPATAVTCALTGTGNLNGAQAYSLNHVPDVVAKVAYEAHFLDRDIHLEGVGLYRDLYDRVALTNGTASNSDTTGYGVGGGLIVPLLPKALDFQVSGLYGRGIGSYGTAQFGDVAFSPNGSLLAIREQMLLGGLTYHATPAIDVYGFAGVEQVDRDYYATNAAGTAFTGYGIPTANNTGCFNYATGGTGCAGNAKRVWQVTGGVWDKLYKGSFGEVRVGAQYSYSQRQLFGGTGTTAAAGAPFTGNPASPRQDEQTILTSLRYYPFQANAAAPPPVVAKY